MSSSRIQLLLVCVAAFGASQYIWHSTLSHDLAMRSKTTVHHETSFPNACPQEDLLYPRVHAALLHDIDHYCSMKEYKHWAYENLLGAVRIPTESYDDLGSPDEDPRWRTRLLFHDYLVHRFPVLHANLSRSVVNNFGLVYHWQGTGIGLKPVLLTGHQDVVPVGEDDVDQWKYPPYSAHFDGDWIWGRGSADDKSSVIGMMNTIELLLTHGFMPARTIVLAFGMDEERWGADGGPAMRKYLIQTYGMDGFFFLLDEGYAFEERNGTMFSTVGVAEKGVDNVRIEVTAPGGHSMVPPRHTTIGLLSILVNALEMHKPRTHLFRNGTYFNTLVCSAEHDQGFPIHLRKLIFKVLSARDDDALTELHDTLLESDDIGFQAWAGTTQALGITGGGVKVNALPTKAFAVANHRIADWSSVSEMRARYSELLRPLAAELNVSMTAFGEKELIDEHAVAHIDLSDAFEAFREPTKASPTRGSRPWEILSGTISAALKDTAVADYRGRRSVVSPGLIIGNSDAYHYLDLTPYVYHHSHVSSKAARGAHGINEGIRADAYLDLTRFFLLLILNIDEDAMSDQPVAFRMG